MASDGEIFRATVNYSQPNSSAVQNVFHWVYSGGATSNANVSAAIADWVETEWGDEWKDLAATDLTLTDVDIIRMNPDGTIAGHLGTFDISLAGTDVGDYLVQAASAFITASTNTPKATGRKYVPGLSDGDVVNGLITAGKLVSMALLVAKWTNDIAVAGGGTLSPGLLSRVLVEFVNFLDAGSITDVPAYQRRRKPNVGS